MGDLFILPMLITDQCLIIRMDIRVCHTRISYQILIAYAAQFNITLYQMDVKSAFLNGYIEEEVYVHQPPGFEDPNYPEHVFKLNKSLYGLKQAPGAWYERFSSFLLEKDFTRGKVDTTIFR